MVDSKENIIVTDASIIIKWLFGKEEDSKKAQKIFEDLFNEEFELVLPSHCFAEVLNILIIKSPEESDWLISQLFLLKPSEQHINLNIAHIAKKIMLECPKTSFYDAAYHSTAIENNGTFITADAKYYKKAKSFKHIKLLHNY